jgi:hypothetical protein
VIGVGRVFLSGKTASGTPYTGSFSKVQIPRLYAARLTSPR